MARLRLGLIVTWVPGADTVPAGRRGKEFNMSDPEVFVGLDVGKSEHHCTALNAAGEATG